VKEGFDCAIRIATRLADSNLVARGLGEIGRVVVASPAYLKSAPPLERPADLARHDCLLYSFSDKPDQWPLTTRNGEERLVRVQGRYRFNNSLLLREAVSQGLGVGFAPLFVMEDLLTSGRVIEVLPAHRAISHVIYGVVAHRGLLAARVLRLFEFVKSQLEQTVPTRK
jgi:DNA-binding transcriptional LysR family regulator